MGFRTPVLAMGIAVLVCAPSLAGPPEDPSVAARRVARKFPASPEDTRIDWDLLVVRAGKLIGTYGLKLRQGENGGWGVADMREEGAASTEWRGMLRRDLRVASGLCYDVGTPRPWKGDWSWDERAYRLRGPDGKESVLDAPHAAMYGVVSFVLFARVVPATPAVYVVPVLDPGAAEGKRLAEARLVVSSEAWEWAGRSIPALVVRVTSGARTTEVWVDAGTRDLLEIREGDTHTVFPFDPSVPARSAPLAVLRVLYAIGAADRKIFEDAVDWEAAHAAARTASDPRARGTPAEYRVARIAALVRRADAETYADTLTALAWLLTTKSLSGDIVVVTYPSTAGGQELRARALSGAWKVMNLP